MIRRQQPPDVSAHRQYRSPISSVKGWNDGAVLAPSGVRAWAEVQPTGVRRFDLGGKQATVECSDTTTTVSSTELPPGELELRRESSRFDRLLSDSVTGKVGNSRLWVRRPGSRWSLRRSARRLELRLGDDYYSVRCRRWAVAVEDSAGQSIGWQQTVWRGGRTGLRVSPNASPAETTMLLLLRESGALVAATHPVISVAADMS